MVEEVDVMPTWIAVVILGVVKIRLTQVAQLFAHIVQGVPEVLHMPLDPPRHVGDLLKSGEPIQALKPVFGGRLGLCYCWIDHYG